MRVVLLAPFYRDKKRSRYKELLTCLKNNLSNSLIDQVVAVTDEPIDLPFHKKLTVINIGRRQTYRALFDLAYTLNPDGVNIVCNADIFWKKEDVQKLKEVDYTNLVLALSRWDVRKKGPAKHLALKDSQDSWVFKGRVEFENSAQLKDGTVEEIKLGIAGCDNVIAHRLQQNYTVMNPSLSIKSYHLHLTGIRNYVAKNAYQPPYYRVPICSHTSRKIKKVLHIGMNPSGQTQLGKTLASFGKYVFFDWQKIEKSKGVDRMREELIRVASKFKADLTFMQIQTPDVIDQYTASRLPGFVVNWTGDVRSEVPAWMKNLGRYVDATCFTNETDVRSMQDEGNNSVFLQIGFEHQLFKPDGPLLATQRNVHPYPDIVFMGNNYGKDRFPLSGERYEIAAALRKAYKNRFLLCGQGWDIDSVNLMGKPKEEAMVYRSCKIAINANHFIHERFSSDRIFRIMGSGAFCLTRWYPGIEKDFTDGVHLRVFRSIDEMLSLVDYYLKNDVERAAIADAGCELIHSKFKWQDNIQLIKQIASFPQEKLKLNDVTIKKPLSNKQWIEYLKTGELPQ